MTLARFSVVACLGVFLVGCATFDNVRDRFGLGGGADSADVASADPATSPMPNETPAPSAPAAQSPVYQSESLRPAGADSAGSSGGPSWNVPEPSLSPSEAPTPGASQGPVPEAGIVQGGGLDSRPAGGAIEDSLLPDLPSASGDSADSTPMELALRGSESGGLSGPIEDPFAPVGGGSKDSFTESFPSLSGGSSTVSPAPANPSPLGTAFGVVRGGAPAPVFTASTMNGGTFDLASHRGRVVVLDFWFSTCGPCLRSMPALEQLRRQFSEDQVVIIGMNADQTRTAAERHIRQSPHPWDHVYTPATRPDLRKTFAVNLYPTFLVIDQVGNIQYRGNNAQQAVAKVVELVQTPSIPQGAGTMAAVR
ncbi:MAG: redoxin family protein [Candidatus Omnitrophica bacterium]|nr:redoxin family protein [Candidatus Omnitrophota bacterium]